MEISVEQSPRTSANPLGRLVEEHRQYSRKLEAILAQPYLSGTHGAVFAGKTRHEPHRLMAS